MGNKFWSILFGVTMLACLIGFAISPLMGWWMPDGVSTHAHDVDFLFYVILYITTFFFILTEAILVAFMWLYSSKEGKPPVSEKVDVAGVLKPLTGLLDSQHKVEMAWTLVPAAILLYIAFAQVTTWANIKYESRRNSQEDVRKTGPALQVGVSARQFEWRMRYPSVERFKSWMKMKDEGEASKKAKADFDSFGKIPQADDIQVVNELHIWQHHQVLVHLTTRDVIHSFNLPNFRVKQDALPGKMIPVWFKTLNPNDQDGKKGVKTFNALWDANRQRYVNGINPNKVEELLTQKKVKKLSDIQFTAQELAGFEDHAYVYDIACAELCGWGHYRMIGRVYVHRESDDFLEWLTKAEAAFRKRD